MALAQALAAHDAESAFSMVVVILGDCTESEEALACAAEMLRDTWPGAIAVAQQLGAQWCMCNCDATAAWCNSDRQCSDRVSAGAQSELPHASSVLVAVCEPLVGHSQSNAPMAGGEAIEAAAVAESIVEVSLGLEFECEPVSEEA